jgi:hypothetical protein
MVLEGNSQFEYAVGIRSTHGGPLLAGQRIDTRKAAFHIADVVRIVRAIQQHCSSLSTASRGIASPIASVRTALAETPTFLIKTATP